MRSNNTLSLIALLAAAFTVACSSGDANEQCGARVTFQSTQQTPATLFSADRPLDFSSTTNRFFTWDTSQTTVCSHARVGEDSVTFTVETTSAIPAGFSVTGFVVVGNQGGLNNAVVLTRSTTANGFLFTGTQKSFDLNSEVATPQTALGAIVQVSFPAVGTRHADSLLLKSVMQRVSYRFQYLRP